MPSLESLTQHACVRACARMCLPHCSADGVGPGPCLWICKRRCDTRAGPSGRLCSYSGPLRLSCVLSVPIPFRGDYIGLQGNPKLQRLKGKEEGPVLVADTVRKVNRGNGKVKSYDSPQGPTCRAGWQCLSSLSHLFSLL